MRAWAIVAVALAAIVAVSAGAPRAVVAQNECSDVSSAGDFSIVTFALVSITNSDSEGRIFAGRNARLENYSVASELPLDRNRIDLAVGNDLEAINVGLNRGRATYGGTLTGNLSGPYVTKAALPVDAQALFDGIAVRAYSWADLKPTAEPTVSGGQLRFVGTKPNRNVFNVSAATLENASEIFIQVPFRATTLINVTGTSYTNRATSMFLWNGSQYVQPGHPTSDPNMVELRKHIVWNFSQARSVNLSTIQWQGGILAPYAWVATGYMQINGTIVANKLTGNGEVHLYPPDLCLPDPQPCTGVPTVTPHPTTGPPPPTPTPTETPTPAPTETPTPTPTPTAPPRPTPTATPTPTPTPTRTPTPTATPGPPPIVRPTPTPETHGPSEPVDPEETPGTVVVEGERSEVDICKKVMTPRGRALESRRVRAGKTVKFRIRVSNLGTNVARDVRVCDIVPRGLTLVRASVPVTYRNGRPCVTIPHLTGQREGFVTMRVARTARGRITNVAAVSSRNGGRRRNPASIRVLPARQSGGGVTG